MKLLDATTDDLRGVMKEQSDETDVSNAPITKEAQPGEQAQGSTGTEESKCKNRAALVSSRLMRTGISGRRG